MVMSGDQNAGRSHNIKIDTSAFERVEQLKYLGTTLTNQNSIQEKIKSRQVGECLLSFGAESFVFQFAVQKLVNVVICKRSRYILQYCICDMEFAQLFWCSCCRHIVSL
jgi:hypothetical protein